jgi:hypothetical protein
MFHLRTALTVPIVGLLWSSAPVAAQPLGTFRWQLLPYCNVLTLNVSQQGGIYTLDGTDDRCSAGQAASARGLALLNPNGTIGFGVTMVQPGGVPVHLETTITLPLLNGTWRDSSGASGNFVQVSGAGFGGPPRLVAPSGLPPGSITAIQLANGAVGAAAVAADSITTGHIVDGTITTADLRDEPQAVSSESTVTLRFEAGQQAIVVRQVTVQAPTGGRVIVNASGYFQCPQGAVNENASCSIRTDSESAPPYAGAAWEFGNADIVRAPFGGTRGFNVAAGTIVFRLNCMGTAGVEVHDPSLTAIFVAGS